MSSSSPADPLNGAAFADSTVYLLTRVAEHMQTQTESLLTSLPAEGVSATTLLRVGRVLGLAELAAVEAHDLAQALIEELDAALDASVDEALDEARSTDG